MALQESSQKHNDYDATKLQMCSKFVSYHKGELNVILSVPHGGRCRPSTIPDRNSRVHHGRESKGICKYQITLQNDMYTVQLADFLASALERYMKKRPHIVINHLHRRKLDCNRNIDEAALGVEEAEFAWRSYHDAIEMAKAAVGGRGLLLDIHGHSHSENWIELGYGVHREKLNSGNYKPSETSIRHLYNWHQTKSSGTDIHELISGCSSLGGMLEKAGYKVIPSPKHPYPMDGNYFSGGYNILKHGSRNGGCLDAIQIESPQHLRSSLVNRWLYANSLAKAIADFLHIHYPSL